MFVANVPSERQGAYSIPTERYPNPGFILPPVVLLEQTDTPLCRRYNMQAGYMSNVCCKRSIGTSGA